MKIEPNLEAQIDRTIGFLKAVSYQIKRIAPEKAKRCFEFAVALDQAASNAKISPEERILTSRVPRRNLPPQ